MDGYYIQTVDQSVSRSKSTKNGLLLHPNDRLIDRPFHHPVDHLVDQFHGPHQSVDRLRRNRFTFLDVQFDVFFYF